MTDILTMIEISALVIVVPLLAAALYFGAIVICEVFFNPYRVFRRK